MKRITAESDTAVDYLIGADLVAEAAGRATGDDAAWLRERAKILRTKKPPEEMRTHAISPKLRETVLRYPDKRFASVSEGIERGCGSGAGTIQRVVRAVSALDSQRNLASTAHLPIARSVWNMSPAWASMWSICRRFIRSGSSFAKGKIMLQRRSRAIAAVRGPLAQRRVDTKRFTAKLGTIEDFRHFAARAGELGLSVALDIAFQVAPDHPYVREHESWFRKRPDGTIQYAENPPKKYQDIFPLDFESEDWAALWEELKSVFLYWLDQGVTIFRVDNPHTKAFLFWEWVIGEIKREHPEVLFLAEAFTRPKVMQRLAKIGFSQSYTYFPWRNGKHEITAYLTELTQTPVREF